ncbi:F-box only protein 30-like isoform X2 [Dreissena polymorpha]|uniref:F-box only protein 30-like isoform X2 n=1 Tax=Dreissena polymorpha TaxID=45954 RepID=UPI0022653F54|nr:F-box only protein 30-like isoform X2 [Dreissena polymorpha]
MTSHAHCSTCIKINCTKKPDDVSSCSLMYCSLDCGFRFHSCKQGEHQLLCLKENVSCINSIYGCPIRLPRWKILSHLTVCPASVVLCSREWNRWPMHSKEEGWKAILPFKHPHVKCAQFDVALALWDQKILMDSFRTPKKTRRILRNCLTQCYPAVPIQSYSSLLESPGSDTSQLSEDESETPWDLNQSPPGLQKTILNQLSVCEGKTSLYAATRQASESLTSALDYVTGKQGLKRLAEAVQSQKELFHVSEIDIKEVSSGMKSVTITKQNDANNSNVNVPTAMSSLEYQEKLLDIYYTDKKLFEILGLDLAINFISSYQAKPLKMYTFLCGREFRRDEYPWHVKNFHAEIQCTLNHWFEQRCPLAYQGCTFAFQRFKPKIPDGHIVHSPILQSFGFRQGDEYEVDMNHKDGKLTEEEDIRTVWGRKRLREATPEIHTSYKCDASVTIIPRYRSVSRETSPMKSYGASFDERECLLTDLPFEVLQNIARGLDGYSLQHLSMTCKLFQNVCCSLLDQCGIVSLVWEKNSEGKWDVAYKKWQFSSGFTSVQQWDFTDKGSALSEHLKTCPYNQDEHKNIKTDPWLTVDTSDLQNYHAENDDVGTKYRNKCRNQWSQ